MLSTRYALPPNSTASCVNADEEKERLLHLHGKKLLQRVAGEMPLVCHLDVNGVIINDPVLFNIFARPENAVVLKERTRGRCTPRTNLVVDELLLHPHATTLHVGFDRRFGKDNSGVKVSGTNRFQKAGPGKMAVYCTRGSRDR